MGHIKCYSTQILGSKVHRSEGHLGCLVPNYKTATLHFYACLQAMRLAIPVSDDGKSYQTQEKHLGDTEWKKWPWGYRDDFFLEMLSQSSQYTWWLTDRHQSSTADTTKKGQSMDQHHGRPVNWGKGGEESKWIWTKEPNRIWPHISLLSCSGKGFLYQCASFGVWLITSWRPYHTNSSQSNFLWRSYSLFWHFILEVW